jgi:UDP-N-acetylglucosamine 2-epimerase (non-hydrolysing)
MLVRFQQRVPFRRGRGIAAVTALKIACIVGARPNFMKMAPLLSAMRGHLVLEPVLIHTGQHYDTAMSGQFLDALEIPSPDYHLGVGSGTHAAQTAAVMVALDKLFRDGLELDLVLVVGDVNSTMAAALVAAKAGIRVAHVEAGLRSFDRGMPEEVNRVVTDALSDLLFVTERSAIANLTREGIAEDRIFFVGNVMIDTLLKYRDRAAELQMPGRYGVAAGDYALVTLHRPSNVDDTTRLEPVMRALEELSTRVPVIFPVHPRTRVALEGLGYSRPGGGGRLQLLDPLGYVEFVGLMAEARLVLTDSGGVQEETTVLGVPCLTLRENTERPVTITEGTNRLVGTDPAAIARAAAEALEAAPAPARWPELWDGRAAERIVDALSGLHRR